MVGLVYVALEETENKDFDVLTVQETKEGLLNYIKEYFGITETNKYPNPATYLGYTKINYSEFEDDLEGYHLFEDYNPYEKKTERHKIWVYCKQLNEICR